MRSQSELAIALLRTCGAHRRPHSGRSLLDHLVGTADILMSWDEAPWVVNAGLIHSVYGSSTGSSRGLLSCEGRPVVAAVVGSEAEEIAYVLSMRSRGALESRAATGIRTLALRDGSTTELSPEQWRAIAAVYVSNLVEQAPRVGLGVLAAAESAVSSLSPLLSDLARDASSAVLPSNWYAF